MNDPTTTQPPWTAAMLDATVFIPVGRGKNAGYAKDEVDAFKGRAVARVAWLEGEITRVDDERVQAREALRFRADSEGPYAPAGPPSIAVSAVSGGQQQAERELGTARAEAHRILTAARRQASEAEDYLRRARESMAHPAPVELPDPPQATGDPEADLEARAAHLRACKELLDDRANDLAEQQGALDEQRSGFVALIDRLAAGLPAVRAEVIDLTPSVDTEKAAS